MLGYTPGMVLRGRLPGHTRYSVPHGVAFVPWSIAVGIGRIDQGSALLYAQPLTCHSQPAQICRTGQVASVGTPQTGFLYFPFSLETP